MGARTALLSLTLSSRCGKRGEKLAGLSCGDSCRAFLPRPVRRGEEQIPTVEFLLA